MHLDDLWLDVKNWLTSVLICRGQHEVVNDDCGKPEHRYCYRCGKNTPDAALKHA